MFSMIAKLRKILSPAYKVVLLILVGMMIFGAMLELLALALIMTLVSAFAAAGSDAVIQSNRYVSIAYRVIGANDPQQFVTRLAVLVIFFYVFKALYCWLSLWCQSWFTTRLSISISKRMFHNYMMAPYEWHTATGSAQLIYRMNQVETFTAGVLKPVLLIATELVVCIAIASVLFITMPAISITATAAAMVLLLVIYLPLRKILVHFGEISTRAGEKTTLFLKQGLDAVREVKLTGTEEFFDRQLDMVQARRLFARKKIQDFSDVPRFVMEAFCIVIAMGALLFMIRIHADFSRILVTAALFVTAMFRLLPSISRIQYSLFSIRSNFFLFDQIYEGLTSLPQETTFDAEEQPVPFTRNIRVDHVTFSYGANLPPVIRDISLEIGCCESVAFVGKTGCGKTTLADLILGFHTPGSGQILIDGVPLSPKNLRAWRKKVGYVPQNLVLFDDTVRANIAFGVEPDRVDEKRYRAALEMSQADSFIQALPQKDMTIIGEEGVRLSGGQRQRLAIARALYSDPELLVFDEATSALDNETEKALIDALKALKGKMTIIMIAHRLSSIEHCDRVISFDHTEVEDEHRSGTPS